MRAIVQLAQLPPRKYVQSRDLARQENLPGKFLESILLALRRGGFLESKVGSGGGYRLSRSPRQIKVGDIVRRLEGRLAATDQSDSRGDSSPGKVAVRLINEQLTAATERTLDDMTLENLIEQMIRAGAGTHAMYYI